MQARPQQKRRCNASTRREKTTYKKKRKGSLTQPRSYTLDIRRHEHAHLATILLTKLDATQGAQANSAHKGKQPDARDDQPGGEDVDGQAGHNVGRRQALGGSRNLLGGLVEQEGRVGEGAGGGGEDAGVEGGFGRGELGLHVLVCGWVRGGDGDLWGEEGFEFGAGGVLVCVRVYC